MWVHYFLTWPDAVPEDAREPERDPNLDGAKDDVVGIAAAQINPDTEMKEKVNLEILHRTFSLLCMDQLNINCFGELKSKVFPIAV